MDITIRFMDIPFIYSSYTLHIFTAHDLSAFQADLADRAPSLRKLGSRASEADAIPSAC